ncbi:MAG: hypothetical protein ACK5PB_23295 [Pirellula sp.]
MRYQDFDKGSYERLQGALVAFVHDEISEQTLRAEFIDFGNKEESWIEHAQHLLGCYMAQELIMDNEVGAFQIVQAVNRLRKIG